MTIFQDLIRVLALIFIASSLFAQGTPPPDASPEKTTDAFIGAEAPLSGPRFALHYFSIDWSAEQWDSLAGRQLELFYVIDDIGEPFLEGVRGVERPDILDSLQAATYRLPYFEPATEGGSPVESLYTIRLSFPAYQPAAGDTNVLYYTLPKPVTREQLAEEYDRTHNAVFIDVNIPFVDHLGRPDAYLKPGGGFDMHIGGRWSPEWGAAMSIGVEFTGRRQPFPDDPFPNRDDQSSTGVYFGGLIDRVLLTTERGLLSIRGELAYGHLNAANRLDPDDKAGWVPYRGVHTGTHLNYSLRLGNYTPNLTFDRSQVTARYVALNFVAGLRYRYYGDREGTGAYYFLGVGVRLGRDDFVRRGR